MKNIFGEKAKYNILIRTKPEKVEHKIIDCDSGFCYWTVNNPPKRKGILKVLFTDGKNVFAEGKFYGTSSDAIEFSALKHVNYPQPKIAPTRGFTYVDLNKKEYMKRNKND